MARDYGADGDLVRVISDVVGLVGNTRKLAAACVIDRSTLYAWMSKESKKHPAPVPAYTVQKLAAGLAAIGRIDLTIKLITDAYGLRGMGLIVSRIPSEGATTEQLQRQALRVNHDAGLLGLDVADALEDGVIDHQEEAHLKTRIDETERELEEMRATLTVVRRTS